MLELFFNNIKENVFAICEYAGNWVLVPCENTMSGIYPRYKEAKVLMKDVNDKFTVFSKLGDNSIDAIVFMKYGDKYEMYYAEDSHDGFQLLTD